MNMEFDDVEECFEIDVDSIADEVEKLDDDDDVCSTIKNLMRKMMRMIKKQDGELRRLKQSQGHNKDMMNIKTNAIHKLYERIVELEKYSRKLCLIFYNFECKGDALSSIMFLFKHIFHINFNPTSLAVCHLLNQSLNAPIIMKFIYHQDRDLIWRRRTWLKGVSNSLGQPVQIEECLAQKDRKVRTEAKQLGLQNFISKQDVYVYNQNLPNADAAQVKSTNELRDFVAPGLSKKSTPLKAVFEIGKCINTPMQMPNFTLKPMSTVTQFVKRKRMKLSPAMESDETPNDNPNLVKRYCEKSFSRASAGFKGSYQGKSY